MFYRNNMQEGRHGLIEALKPNSTPRVRVFDFLNFEHSVYEASAPYSWDFVTAYNLGLRPQL